MTCGDLVRAGRLALGFRILNDLDSAFITRNIDQIGVVIAQIDYKSLILLKDENYWVKTDGLERVKSW